VSKTHVLVRAPVGLAVSTLLLLGVCMSPLDPLDPVQAQAFPPPHDSASGLSEFGDDEELTLRRDLVLGLGHLVTGASPVQIAVSSPSCARASRRAAYMVLGRVSGRTDETRAMWGNARGAL
jgi:hypothetical protein